ncbi:hypothetical protein GQX73_g2935 [Xylaria multiplex]|uniref:Uncharacterized protein n=1 Tax=Xylaria multiplex TaxID=323545 RepID=A0A7C8IRT8_9PEZI|nr:hypothetical protein GQX73_g2935 [Xylaria multiplex]
MYPNRDWVIDPGWNFPFGNSVYDTAPGAINCSMDFDSYGRNSYAWYLTVQKDFVTWLVQAAAKFGEHVQSIDSFPFIKDTLISFRDLIRLANVVARKGRVSQVAFNNLEHMINLRVNFDTTINKLNQNQVRREECLRQNSYAIETLRNVRDLLKSTPTDVNETIRITETYSLPPLPDEAFFSIQIFVDISILIRGCSPTPFDDLQEHGNNKKALFAKYANHDTIRRMREEEDHDHMSIFITIVSYYAKCLKKDAHFIVINDSEPNHLENNPLNRYLADIFDCYFEHDVYHCDLQLVLPEPPSKETLDKIVNAVWPYPQMSWREEFREELGFVNKKPVNTLRILSLVRAARYLDEMLASFDLFGFHDICTKFFNQLRRLYRDKFDIFEKEQSNSGLNYAPKTSTDDTFSLDALYYLTFAERPDKRIDNMILASLCFDIDTMRAFDLPTNEKFLCETWGDGIIRHAKELDISLESAATILRPLIKEEGSVIFKRQAETQRAYHKRRVGMESWLVKFYDGWDNENWYHACHTQPKKKECCQPAPGAQR